MHTATLTRSSNPRRTQRLLVVAVAAGLLATACGSGDDSSTDSSTGSDTDNSSLSLSTDPATDDADDDMSNDAAPDNDAASSTDPTDNAASSDGLLRARETAQETVLETADGQTVYGNLDFVIQDATGCPDPGPELCGDFVPLLSPTGDVASDGLDPAAYIIVDNPLGPQLAYTKSLEKGIPLYTYSSEGPGEYTGMDFGSSWYPMGALGKMVNSFDPELE